jgi:hypothetical protein
MSICSLLVSNDQFLPINAAMTHVPRELTVKKSIIRALTTQINCIFLFNDIVDCIKPIFIDVYIRPVKLK